MPFDNSEWQARSLSKPVTFDLPGLIAWLKTRPMREAYQYSNSRCCLAAQFNRAVGREYHVATQRGDIRKHLDEGTFERVLEIIAGRSPHTVLGALQRASRLAEGAGL